MIAVIDYKVGNLGSIQNMLKKIHVDFLVTSDPGEIEKADKLILPGVGSFGTGMRNLKDLGLREILDEMVLTRKTPILGICLGMQLFSKGSEEGSASGLNWIDSEVLRFSFGSDQNLKVPHMGWVFPKICKESRLFISMYDDPKFYMVHSYYMHVADPNDILATAIYGIEYAAAVEKGNIIGVQFHPEKSHKYGMKLLKNYAEMF
jgi:imidazole glycerol-phosphate synthase subunit HisH